MDVRRLTLQNFRNYASLDLDFCPGVNLISGANGQGKTNILEAIFLCTCARSHRTSKDHELIRHGEDGYRVDLETAIREKGELVHDVDTSVSMDHEQLSIEYLESKAGDPFRKRNQRIVRHNGVKLDRISELMGLFNAVIFAPEDIMLIKGSPQVRRRFMDLLISQMKRRYFLALQRYSQVLNQRNSLLKTIRDRAYQNSAVSAKDLQTQLDIWDQAFIVAAAEITFERKKWIHLLAERAEDYHWQISSEKEKLLLRYESFKAAEEAEDLDELTQAYSDRLDRVRDDEIARGSTQIGPHRDDLDLLLNGKSLKLYGSQGQQRTAVLALKQAELEVIRIESKVMPVLLLDDVLPELDERRRISLISSIRDAQVFITCTDYDEVHDRLRRTLQERGSFRFRVNDDQVIREQDFRN